MSKGEQGKDFLYGRGGVRQMRKIFFLSLLILCFASIASGNTVTREEARIVAQNWLNKDRNTMKASLGREIDSVVHYSGESYGTPGYYVVFLSPQGWLLVPAAESFEPVLAFGEGRMTPEQFESSRLAAMIKLDTPVQRASAAKSAQTSEDDEAKEIAKKWSYLKGTRMKRAEYGDGKPRKDIKDEVVPPILAEYNWGQGRLHKKNEKGEIVDFKPFFNSSVTRTEKGTPWEADEYLVGCAALVAGKLLRYHEYEEYISNLVKYPEDKWDVYINNDSAPQGATLIGGSLEGDDSGDSGEMVSKFDWKLMPPHITWQDHANRDDVRREIAALLHDCGVLMESRYMRVGGKPLTTVKG